MVRNKQVPPPNSGKRAVRVLSRLMQARQRELAAEVQTLEKLKNEKTDLERRSEEQKTQPALAIVEQQQLQDDVVKQQQQHSATGGGGAASSSGPQDELSKSLRQQIAQPHLPTKLSRSKRRRIASSLMPEHEDVTTPSKKLHAFPFLAEMLPSHRRLNQNADDDTSQQQSSLIDDPGAQVNFLRSTLDREMKIIAQSDQRMRQQKMEAAAAAAAVAVPESKSAKGSSGIQKNNSKEEQRRKELQQQQQQLQNQTEAAALPGELIFSRAVDNLLDHKWRSQLTPEQRQAFSPHSDGATTTKRNAAHIIHGGIMPTLPFFFGSSSSSGASSSSTTSVPQRSPFVCFASAVLRVPLHSDIVASTPEGKAALAGAKQSRGGGQLPANEEISEAIREVSGWNASAAANATAQEEKVVDHQQEGDGAPISLSPSSSSSSSPAAAAAAVNAPSSPQEMELRIAELADYWNRDMTREQRAAVAKLAQHDQDRAVSEFESAFESLLSKSNWTAGQRK